ncbi:hypothetical protein ABT288_26435 [Streptomyces sp. NPDC001093]|uniref:hypothetical protein n=1 Tax=Streptomyces sp. NPDC001093 TaxID=3154376 RepID=UPI0033342C22
MVVAACVTGSLIVGGFKGDNADGGSRNTKAPASAPRSPTASAPTSKNPRGSTTQRPTVPGWKVVINPEWGTAFDVPPDWDVKPSNLLFGFENSKLDYNDPKNAGEFVIMMGAPAVLQEDWCLSDADKDGRVDGTALAVAGTKGAEGARSTADAALSQSVQWVYGGYTQPDRKSIVSDRTARPYTTTSGLKGSIAWARSKNAPRNDKCTSDGKAITFSFKDSAGGLVAWSLLGATGVRGELPDRTIMKILSTVRLHGKPTES